MLAIYHRVGRSQVLHVSQLVRVAALRLDRRRLRAFPGLGATFDRPAVVRVVDYGRALVQHRLARHAPDALVVTG